MNDEGVSLNQMRTSTYLEHEIQKAKMFESSTVVLDSLARRRRHDIMLHDMHGMVYYRCVLHLIDVTK